MLASFGPLVQIIWAELKSNGHISTKTDSMTSKNPDETCITLNVL